LPDARLSKSGLPVVLVAAPHSYNLVPPLVLFDLSTFCVFLLWSTSPCWSLLSWSNCEASSGDFCALRSPRCPPTLLSVALFLAALLLLVVVLGLHADSFDHLSFDSLFAFDFLDSLATLPMPLCMLIAALPPVPPLPSAFLPGLYHMCFFFPLFRAQNALALLPPWHPPPLHGHPPRFTAWFIVPLARSSTTSACPVLHLHCLLSISVLI
jgi:hypothetical protein